MVMPPKMGRVALVDMWKIVQEMETAVMKAGLVMGLETVKTRHTVVT